MGGFSRGYKAEQNNADEACRIFSDAIEKSRMAGAEGKNQLGRSLIANRLSLKTLLLPIGLNPFFNNVARTLAPIQSTVQRRGGDLTVGTS